MITKQSVYRPAWTRSDHPIVRRYLRRPFSQHYNYAIFAAVLSLFMLFGGLSLPLLYFLFSLTVLLHIAIATADKIQTERECCTWDLMRSAPFSNGEILLSIWASSVHQLNRTWIMWIYRLLQGLVVIGLMVYAVWFGEIPTPHWPVVLVGGTLVIVIQPFVDMFYSGMIGLLSAHLMRDRFTAQGFAVGAVLAYWLLWIGLALVILLSNMQRVTGSQVIAVLLLPLMLPLLMGYGAYRVVHARMF